MQAYPVLSFLVLVLLCALTIFLFKKYSKTKTRLALHSSSAALTVSLFTALLLFVPQILENIVRFWAWVFSLSSMKHEAFGTVAEVVQGGYLTLFLSENMSLTLVLFFGGLAVFFYKLFQKEIDLAKPEFLLCLSVIVLWMILLNVSSKQAWRYAIPILPFVQRMHLPWRNWFSDHNKCGKHFLQHSFQVSYRVPIVL